MAKIRILTNVIGRIAFFVKRTCPGEARVEREDASNPKLVALVANCAREKRKQILEIHSYTRAQYWLPFIAYLNSFANKL